MNLNPGINAPKNWSARSAPVGSENLKKRTIADDGPRFAVCRSPPESFIRPKNWSRSTAWCFTRIKRDIDLTKISKTDLVILYATAFGNLAVRCAINGSLFIQKLCRELQTRKKRTIEQDCYN